MVICRFGNRRGCGIGIKAGRGDFVLKLSGFLSIFATLKKDTKGGIKSYADH
jgi:hypothetical protein